jgi:hypothetical protein
MLDARRVRLPKYYGDMWSDIRGEGEMPELNRTHLVTLHRGKFDPDAWLRSIGWVIERHPVLRACIVTGTEGPQFQLQPTPAVPLLRIDLGKEGNEDLQARLQHTAHTLVWQPFDPQVSLCRPFMIAASDAEYVLGIVIHHLIADGWSLDVLGREMLLGYIAARAGRRPSLPDPLMQFPDYLEWLSDWLEGEEARSQKSYWERRLSQASPVRLPVGQQVDPETPVNVATQSMEFDKDLLCGLGAHARELKTTPFLLLLTAKFAALSIMTGATDIVMVVLSEGREEFRLRNTIGYFPRYLPIRVEVDLAQTPAQLLRHVQETYREAWDHRQYPYLPSNRLLGRFPWFRYRRVAAPDSIPDRHKDGFHSFEMPPPPRTRLKAKLYSPHFLEIDQVGDTACGTLRYPTDTYEPETVTTFMRIFGDIVKAIARADAAPLRSFQ